jgi:hypothetical protein
VNTGAFVSSDAGSYCCTMRFALGNRGSSLARQRTVLRCVWAAYARRQPRSGRNAASRDYSRRCALVSRIVTIWAKSKGEYSVLAVARR